MKHHKQHLYLTYVNNSFDKHPKALTRSKMNELLDSAHTRQYLHNYRSGNKQDDKRLLPAVLFNGRYSPEKAEKHMASAPSAGEKEHTRRDAPCYVNGPLLALDIDVKDPSAPSAKEQFTQAWAQIEHITGMKPEHLVVMAYCTPTTPGWRLVVKRQKGLDIPQLHSIWNKILPYPCDAVCKNANRLYFITPREELLYYNEDMLFDTAEYSPEDYPDCSEKSEKSDYSEYSEKFEYSEKPIYSEETLTDIVAELEHCVGGGTAQTGNRNNQVFQMAVLMRYLTGDNITLLTHLIPTYGLAPSEHLRTINNALKARKLPYLPLDLRRAIVRATGKNYTQPSRTSSTPPPMPQILPPAIEHLVSAIPEKAQPAAAINSFAAWRIHLHEVAFEYIDHTVQEPSFACICCAEQTAGKTSIRMPSECILATIAQEDSQNRETEQQWREQCACLSSNKNKPKAPALPIRIVEADMTNPALVKRAAQAQGYSLYTYAEEIEKLKKLSGFSEILRSAYDGARYGQERVSANAISQVVDKLRWSFNVSTTPATARATFKNEITNGTFTRISLTTIISDPMDYGDEMPIYGDFGEEYSNKLSPYIEQLRTATGNIHCTEALEWAENERHRQIDILRSKDQHYMVPFMRRSLQMGFWRAMILYIMNGYQWSTEIADFASWSIDYDLWCKLYYFADLIEGCNAQLPDNSKYNKSLLTQLPNQFTLEQARNVRRDAGRTVNSKDLRNMLSQWIFRGFIYLDTKQNIYIKTNQVPS